MMQPGACARAPGAGSSTFGSPTTNCSVQQATCGQPTGAPLWLPCPGFPSVRTRAAGRPRHCLQRHPPWTAGALAEVRPDLGGCRHPASLRRDVGPTIQLQGHWHGPSVDKAASGQRDLQHSEELCVFLPVEAVLDGHEHAARRPVQEAAVLQPDRQTCAANSKTVSGRLRQSALPRQAVRAHFAARRRKYSPPLGTARLHGCGRSG
jgi:hypothetical protein